MYNQVQCHMYVNSERFIELVAVTSLLMGLLHHLPPSHTWYGPTARPAAASRCTQNRLVQLE